MDRRLRRRLSLESTHGRIPVLHTNEPCRCLSSEPQTTMATLAAGAGATVGAVSTALDWSNSVAKTSFQVALEIGENFPIVGILAKIGHKIYSTAETARHSKEYCRQAGKRCEILLRFIATCAREYQRQGTVDPAHIACLETLKTEMEKLSTSY